MVTIKFKTQAHRKWKPHPFYPPGTAVQMGHTQRPSAATPAHSAAGTAATLGSLQRRAHKTEHVSWEALQHQEGARKGVRSREPSREKRQEPLQLDPADHHPLPGGLGAGRHHQNVSRRYIQSWPRTGSLLNPATLHVRVCVPGKTPITDEALTPSLCLAL